MDYAWSCSRLYQAALRTEAHEDRRIRTELGIGRCGNIDIDGLAVSQPQCIRRLVAQVAAVQDRGRDAARIVARVFVQRNMFRARRPPTLRPGRRAGDTKLRARTANDI